MISSRKTWCQGWKVDLGGMLHKLGFAAHLAISIHWLDLEEMNQMCVSAAWICTQVQLSLNTWSHEMLKQSLMVLTGSFAFEENTCELQWTHPLEESYQGPNEDVGFWAMSCMRNPQAEILVCSTPCDFHSWGQGFLRKCTEGAFLRLRFQNAKTLKWSLVVLTESFCFWRKYMSTPQRTHPFDHATKVQTLTWGP